MMIIIKIIIITIVHVLDCQIFVMEEIIQTDINCKIKEISKLNEY